MRLDRLVFETLSMLRRKFEKSCGIFDYQVSESGCNVSARQFYLTRLEDNLIRNMDDAHIAEYARGSGCELDDKMLALRSSSAMTYNLLGNKACTLVDGAGFANAGKYAVSYEFQIPTLSYGMPANLDALLTCDDGSKVIACEMKMMEWLTSSPSALKAKYFEHGSYIYEDAASTFIRVARDLEGNAFESYDYAQMFKHTLALYNAVRSDKFDNADKMTLVNCVWEPQPDNEVPAEIAERLELLIIKERSEFDVFHRAIQPIDGLFADIGIGFDLRYVSAQDLIDALVYPDDERAKLARYR